MIGQRSDLRVSCGRITDYLNFWVKGEEILPPVIPAELVQLLRFSSVLKEKNEAHSAKANPWFSFIPPPPRKFGITFPSP